MLKLIVEIILIITVAVLLINHWDAVVAFFNAAIDWIVYGMKAVSTGPPEIPSP